MSLRLRHAAYRFFAIIIASAISPAGSPQSRAAAGRHRFVCRTKFTLKYGRHNPGYWFRGQTRLGGRYTCPLASGYSSHRYRTYVASPYLLLLLLLLLPLLLYPQVLAVFFYFQVNGAKAGYCAAGYDQR